MGKGGRAGSSYELDAARSIQSKFIVAKDNVHLTTSGYKALAEGIFREALNFGIVRSKGKHSLSGLQMVKGAEWHGFVCNQGVGRTSLKAAKRPLGGKGSSLSKKKMSK